MKLVKLTWSKNMVSCQLLPYLFCRVWYLLPTSFLTDWMVQRLEMLHAIVVDHDHPLTTSVSLLISFDFKMIIKATVTIIGRDGRKDDASFRKSFLIKEKRVRAGRRAVD